MSGRLRAFYLALALSVLIPRAPGAEWFVDIYDYYFTPTNLLVNQGDTVTWINRGLQAHDTTSLDSLWASELLYNEEQPFSFIFTNAGSYPYICLKHIDEYPDQTGLVVVASVNLPPSVQVTNPINGSVLVSPASFVIGVEAQDAGGTVSSVELFLNDVSLVVFLSPPFVTNVNGLGNGNYVIKAIATDELGAAATNSVSFTVQDNPATTYTLTLSVSPPNGGTVLVTPAPVGGVYLANTNVALAPQPAADFRFAYWTNDVAPAAKTNNPLLLTMNSDKNVLAVFVPIPPLIFSTVDGRYFGLLIDESATNYRTSGFISLRVTRAGSFYGTATIGGIPSVMRGQFDHRGYATLSMRRGSLIGSLQIDPNGWRMTGTISDGKNSPALALYRISVSTNAGPFAGDYSLTFAAEAPVANPGAGSLRILSNAGARDRGVLGDGRIWSDRTFLTLDGRVPVFVPLYQNRGAMLGWLNVAGDGTVSGDVRWFRPGDSRSRTFPDGFEIKIPVTGSRND